MGNSGTQFLVAPTTSAVNYVQVTGNATTSRPVISAQGSDANIGLQLASKGNRSISLLTNSVTSLDVLSPASGVNYFTLNGSITNLSPSIVSTGTDTNIGLNLTTKGTGALSVNTGGGEQVRILDTASTDASSVTAIQFRVRHINAPANYCAVIGAPAGSTPEFQTLGTDTNIDLALTPKGTGLVRFGTHTATALTISGYIEIKDAGGTIRKLAVVT